jgi:hypothetical protein
MSNIIRNAFRTPDGTILESKSRWDYKEHVDTTNGKTYVIDGGLDYFRRSVHSDQVDLAATLDDDHEVVREAMTWGTYGINGDQPLQYVKLKDMSLEHIHACLEEVKNMHPQYRTAMKTELEYRHDKFQANDLKMTTAGDYMANQTGD